MYIHDDNKNLITTYHIIEGRKTYMPNEKLCIKHNKELNNLGVKTRVCYNDEADMWSIYIVSIPEELELDK